MAHVNKLVRDNIPAIIISEGRRPITRVLSDDEYAVELEKKLQEEVAEFIDDQTISELADILEVVYALAKHRSFSEEAIDEARHNKATANGIFETKTFLIDTDAS